MANAKIVTFANQKGGVGKSTSVVNIAASLGVLGKRVLVVDVDPQGNTTSGFGISKKSSAGTVYDVLIGRSDAADAVQKTEFENISVIPKHFARRCGIRARHGRQQRIPSQNRIGADCRPI